MSLSTRVVLRLRSNYLQKSPFTHSKTAYRKLHATTAKMPVQRITMFKVANEADIPQFVEKYQTLKQDQKKDGKPYILSVDAHKPVNDPRTQGYNLVANTSFSSLDDVKYYDEKCEAHGAFKAFAKEKVAGPPMVVMWESS